MLGLSQRQQGWWQGLPGEHLQRSEHNACMSSMRIAQTFAAVQPDFQSKVALRWLTTIQVKVGVNREVVGRLSRGVVEM